MAISDSDILGLFGRHLVAICVTYHQTGSNHAGGMPRFAAYNGTLIRTKHRTCFLTAGHVIAELEDMLGNDKVAIENVVLADTFGTGRITDHPIPFDLNSAQFHFIDEDDEGLDFGVIVLSPYYVSLLEKNNIGAIREDHWIRQPEIQFDAYAMFGLPQESTSPRVSASGQGIVTPTMFRVKRLSSPPEDNVPTRHPRFVGEIDRELQIESLKGMSGGPIFGFRIGRELRYWIVALQSSWLPERRIAFGCPLPVMVPYILEWAGE